MASFLSSAGDTGQGNRGCHTCKYIFLAQKFCRSNHQDLWIIFLEDVFNLEAKVTRSRKWWTLFLYFLLFWAFICLYLAQTCISSMAISLSLEEKVIKHHFCLGSKSLSSQFIDTILKVRQGVFPEEKVTWLFSNIPHLTDPTQLLPCWLIWILKTICWDPSPLPPPAPLPNYFPDDVLYKL